MKPLKTPFSKVSELGPDAIFKSAKIDIGKATLIGAGIPITAAGVMSAFMLFDHMRAKQLRESLIRSHPDLASRKDLSQLIQTWREYPELRTVDVNEFLAAHKRSRMIADAMGGASYSDTGRYGLDARVEDELPFRQFVVSGTGLDRNALLSIPERMKEYEEAIKGLDQDQLDSAWGADPQGRGWHQIQKYMVLGEGPRPAEILQGLRQGPETRNL
jgi:hypothetical protein